MKRVLVLVLATALLLSGCTAIPELDLDRIPICQPEARPETPTEYWPMPNWGSESVDLYLQFSEPIFLNLTGADYLAIGDVELLSQFRWRYNVSCLDPWVQLATDGERASLTLVQNPLFFGPPQGTTLVNEWNFEVTRTISSSLRLNAEEVQGSVDLTGLRLSALAVNTDDSDMTITFASPNPEKLTLFDVQTSDSTLNMTGLGNANFDMLALHGGGGTYNLRFGGAWSDSAEAEIRLGESHADIFVPQKVGLRVEIQGEPPHRNMVNLQQETETLYVSAGFAEAEPKFVIRISMTAGSLTVRWGEGEQEIPDVPFTE